MNIPEHVQEIIFRVINADFKSEDKAALVGETYVNFPTVIDRGVSELVLTKEGKVGGFGTLTYSVESMPPPYDTMNQYGQRMKCVKVHIHRATKLSKLRDYGHNDIFIQAYPKPDGIVIESGYSLPEPAKTILPTATAVRTNSDFMSNTYSNNSQLPLIFPFEFQLPLSLPPSTVTYRDDYILYSIYTRIDMNDGVFTKDPSTRIYFTVIPPIPTYQLLTPIQQQWSEDLYTQCCIPPCCCSPFSLNCGCKSHGNLKATLSADRSGYAPGETVTLSIDYQCNWPEFEQRVFCHMIYLERIITLRAHSRYYTITDQLIDPPIIESKTKRSFTFVMPSVPPTYTGGILNNQATRDWIDKLNQEEGEAVENGQFDEDWSRGKTAVKLNRGIDPITWTYRVKFMFTVRLPGLNLVQPSYTILLPIGVTGVGLNALLPPAGYSIPLSTSDSVQVIVPNTMDRGEGDINKPNQAPLPKYDWKIDEYILNAYPTILSKSQIVPGFVEGFIMNDHEGEDASTVDVNRLRYQPFYLSCNINDNVSPECYEE